jgi:hypothetical protein
MKMEKRLLLPLILSAVLSTMFLTSFTGTVRAAAQAQLVIQPSNYTYYAGYTAPPATLTFNISVLNVANMSTWQVGIQWNSSLLGYMNITTGTFQQTDPLFPIIAGPDTSVPGLVVYGAAQSPGATPFTGSRLIAQMILNVTPAVTPPVSSDITFEGIGSDTFLLYGLVVINMTTVSSKYAYWVSPPGTPVTHSISGSTNPVVTHSNGTVTPNSAAINTTSKTISFNVTGTTGDTAYMYAELPKNVINCTDVSRWNITLNGVLYTMSSSMFQISENATYTIVYVPSFTFGSQVNLGVQGTYIVPELPNLLLVLLIASSATVAMIKIRTKKKI